jgi:hypothetical protein
MRAYCFEIDRSSVCDGDDLGVDEVAVADLEQAHGSGRLAAAIGWRAWVEDAEVRRLLVHGDVRVAEDDEIGCRKAPAEPRQPASRGSTVVNHRHRQPVDIELLRRRRAPSSDIRSVVVAEHRDDGCVRRQLIEHRSRADVSRVEDEIDVFEPFGDPRRARFPKARRMGVREHGDPHHVIVARAGTAIPGRARWPDGRLTSCLLTAHAAAARH